MNPSRRLHTTGMELFLPEEEDGSETLWPESCGKVALPYANNGVDGFYWFLKR
jgi:hypothetical protein